MSDIEILTAPATKANIPPRVRADDHANESWIVTSYHFFRHGSHESAIAARDHLAAQFPKKQFHIWRVKAKLGASTTKARIAALKEQRDELLAALKALYDACEYRANTEGGDFGPDIGPAAKQAEAAIARAEGRPP